MADVTRIYLFVFALLSIAGGLLGFVKSKSKASVIAGSVAGGFLFAAGYLIGTPQARAGVIIGLVTSVLLAGRFVPSFAKTKKVMPAGVMSALSVVGVVLTVALLVNG